LAARDRKVVAVLEMAFAEGLRRSGSGMAGLFSSVTSRAQHRKDSLGSFDLSAGYEVCMSGLVRVPVSNVFRVD
jgi:hypothetical protein